MTTPSKNVHEVSIDTARLIVSPFVGPPYTTVLGDFNYGWVDDVRPESSNAPRVGGYKCCSPWLHTGGDIRARSSGATIVYNTTNKQKLTWPGLSFWGQSNALNPPTAALPTGGIINRAEQKALEKLKSQDFHLGNFLAEGKRTINLVASGSTTIANAVLGFRRRYPGDWDLVRAWQSGNLPRHLWCKIPQKWLELQYGWIPLMSDIFGAAHHLSKTSRKEIPFIVVKSTVKDKDLLLKTHPGRSLNCAARAWFEVQQKVGVQLTYKLNSPILAELSSLGLINPAEIIWELTRYSFVVDWFLPVGAWLSSLTGDVGYSFVTGSQSRTARMRYQRSELFYNPPLAPNLKVLQNNPPGWSGERKSFSRTCYESSPVPGLYVKNPLSLKHAANGIALLARAFR